MNGFLKKLGKWVKTCLLTSSLKATLSIILTFLFKSFTKKLLKIKIEVKGRLVTRPTNFSESSTESKVSLVRQMKVAAETSATKNLNSAGFSQAIYSIDFRTEKQVLMYSCK